jgi:hypothetical protein
MTDQPLDETERALLAELLAGERAETETEIMDLLRRRPALRTELSTLGELAGGLDRGGAERAAEIEEARGSVTEDDIAAARRVLGTLPPRQRGTTRRTWIAIAAVAAGLLLALLALWPSGGSTGTSDPRLGAPTRDDIVLAPRGPVAFEVFTWHSTTGKPIVPAGGHLRIVVYRVQDGHKTDEVLLDKSELEGKEWRPSPELLLPVREAREFAWELRGIELDGDEVLLQEARVQPPG